MQEENMNHKLIGFAKIGDTKTSIREYKNGFFIVELDAEVLYSGQSLKELTDTLDKASIEYTIFS